MNKQLSRIDTTDLALNDNLIYINRVAKVMKGGKRLRFSALVVTGDGDGHVGIGIGKANEVPAAINKGGAKARKSLIRVPLAGSTIPHEVRARWGAARVILRPASPGTGLIAGGAMRPLLEAAGIKDVLAKSLGSENPINIARATLEALRSLRTAEEVAARRGRKASEIAPPWQLPGEEGEAEDEQGA